MGVETTYKIYRQVTSSGIYNFEDFELIKANCADNFFIDIGKHPDIPVSVINRKPPEVTITEFSKPNNLSIYHRTNVSQTNTNRRSNNNIRIVLYQKGSSEIPTFQLERLIQLLKDFVPPELGFTIILCNDNYSKILI